MLRSQERRPITLRAPITLGVVLIVLLVILTAVWVTGTLIGALRGQASPELYWAMLLAGSVLLIAVLAGVIAYLALSVKSFNLNRRQSNFIDAVTHELKSPIASLKLYLQTMTRHAVNQEQSEAFHKIMLEDVERLDTLINHLLDAASVERGVIAQEAKDFVLVELIKQVATATCVRYKLPPETVTIDCQDILLHAPQIQVEILLRNLVDNAVKYGANPPRVRIMAQLTAKPVPVTKSRFASRRSSSHGQQTAELTADAAPLESGEVTMSVCDNGVGIPANLRRKVFGRFVRLGNELERSSPGTGLGLYLVRNVTHALGGRINIHDAQNVDFGEPLPTQSSENDTGGPTNQGTRFDITLPNARLRATV
ncbi:sensor histidine kinase [Neorhodopirellula pilleata]|uniref:histidine kinase n=1 Tax=Neorhodopirellula pilleata TaxID=2714738 RepID=A0A5C6AXA3_9BACT|nr:HAMP domain-containing sensor histidine kinase [Neorhodopirellula pilleata]TWU03789.1 Sensory/regulatory protein RpfC [Neorhodopirellula pilleata]